MLELFHVLACLPYLLSLSPVGLFCAPPNRPLLLLILFVLALRETMSRCRLRLNKYLFPFATGKVERLSIIDLSSQSAYVSLPISQFAYHCCCFHYLIGALIIVTYCPVNISSFCNPSRTLFGVVRARHPICWIQLGSL